jgi:hypothetical protein
LLLQTVDENGTQIYHLSVILMFLVQTHLFSLFPSKACSRQLIKHTLINCEATEVVINVVNFDMVQQTSLASTEYADGVNEF